jgi:hypothetical protein
MLDIEVIEDKENGCIIVKRRNGNTVRAITIGVTLKSKNVSELIAEAASRLSDERLKTFEIEMGMTKAEYEIKEKKEEKEYRQDTRFHFSTKNYFIILGIGVAITIILSIIYPQPNLCEKYGSDWKYDSGGKGVRSACINLNGDIKYIKTK